MKLNRFSAFAIHFALSLLIFASLVLIMYFYWFPGDLFFMDGGWEGIKLVAMVDLVLGPALTLMLFKPGKPSLVMDMSVVAAIQLAALSYGFYATYTQRVVALVHSENTFRTLTASELESSSEALRKKGITPVALSSFEQASPVNVVTLKFDSDSYGEYLESLFNDFPGIRERNDKYLRLPENYEVLKAQRLGETELAEQGKLELVKELLADTKHKFEDVDIYPFEARYENGFAVFDPAEMRVVDILRHTGFEDKAVAEKTADEEAAAETTANETTVDKLWPNEPEAAAATATTSESTSPTE